MSKQAKIILGVITVVLSFTLCLCILFLAVSADSITTFVTNGFKSGEKSKDCYNTYTADFGNNNHNLIQCIDDKLYLISKEKLDYTKIEVFEAITTNNEKGFEGTYESFFYIDNLDKKRNFYVYPLSPRVKEINGKEHKVNLDCIGIYYKKERIKNYPLMSQSSSYSEPKDTNCENYKFEDKLTRP